MSTITPDENIDPVLRERSSPASLSPTKQNNGEFISKADFSAQMYVHSQSVPESNSEHPPCSASITRKQPLVDELTRLGYHPAKSWTLDKLRAHLVDEW
jgi:hypothetical protein